MEEPVTYFSHESCCNAIWENLKSIGKFHGTYPDIVVWDREDLFLYSHGFPHPYAQGVWNSDLNEGNADDVIEEVLGYFKERNLPFWWLFGHQTKPRDLGDRLKARGFFNSGDMTYMAADLSKINLSIPAHENFEIREVRTISELRTFFKIWSIGYEYPAILGDNFYEGVIKKPLSYLDRHGKLYMGYLNGSPVATSRLHIGAGAVGLYWVTVIPEARGKGIGTQMSIRPLKDGLDAGYKLGVLDATEMGYPVYKKMSFEEYFKSPVYIWMPNPDLK
jgi:GNAT superfamily N-acetyltransferase